MKFYHATTEENALKIVRDGKIKMSAEGAVYLFARTHWTHVSFWLSEGLRK